MMVKLEILKSSDALVTKGGVSGLSETRMYDIFLMADESLTLSQTAQRDLYTYLCTPTVV